MIVPNTARAIAGVWIKKNERLASGVRWSLLSGGGQGGRLEGVAVGILGNVDVEVVVVCGRSHHTATTWPQPMPSQSVKSHSYNDNSWPLHEIFFLRQILGQNHFLN